MDQVEIKLLTNDEIAALASTIPFDQIPSILNQMDPKQISIAIAAWNETHDSEWKKKTKKAIFELVKTESLEAAGKTLSLAQALAVLEDMHTVENFRDKLSPLLVGMPHSLFIQILSNATTSQMEVFKQESATEPLQHHLTVLCHEVATQFVDYEAITRKIEYEIDFFNVKEIGSHELIALKKEIEKIWSFFQDKLNEINKALEIAWKSGRMDLIEKLSALKEICLKFRISIVGYPSDKDDEEAKGLFAKLERRLNSVFGDPNNPHDFEALKDDEPAIEGLSKLSLWYLQDYWAVGLLPKISHLEEIEHVSLSYAEKNQEQWRENLMLEVKNNLQHLGLVSVADLKKSGIFSKKLLEEFIQNSKAKK